MVVGSLRRGCWAGRRAAAGAAGCAPWTSYFLNSTFALKYLMVSSMMSSPGAEQGGGWDVGRLSENAGAGTQQVRSWAGRGRVLGCNKSNSKRPSRIAPSAFKAGPRALVFSGSSAHPHACGDPSGEISEWYTCEPMAWTKL